MFQTAISHSSEHQTLVNTHFQSHLAQWRDVYEQDGVEGAIYRKRLEIVLSWIDELALPAGKKILEIGCGSGKCTVALAQRGYFVHAMDSVAGMLDVTEQHAVQAGVQPSISTSLGDAHNLAFANGNFALVLAIGVLPYLHSPQKALREMARVIRPGGVLIVTAANRWGFSNLLDPWLCPPLQPARRVIGAIRRLSGKPRIQPSGPPVRRGSRRDLERWLSSAGLAKIKVSTVGFPPLTVRFRPIVGERTSTRLNNWLQRLADRDVPGIRLGGMDYIVLATKSEDGRQTTDNGGVQRRITAEQRQKTEGGD